MYISSIDSMSPQANNKTYVLYSISGDVNGDKIPDNIYLVGNKPFGVQSPFSDNIMLIINDGATHYSYKIQITANAGYNPTVFLGDFTGNKVNDILVSIDSGGSGGFGYYYIFSFLNNKAQKLFDYELFNKYYNYDATYIDNYQVEVINKTLGKLFVIDIKNRDQSYLSELYSENGKLKNPTKGYVSGLNTLYPIDIQRDGVYELFALQRITGKYSADSLGLAQTTLTWNGQSFIALNQDQSVAIWGTSIT